MQATTPLEVDRDPIAIVGMGCRFPQANTPDDFWQLLKNGSNIIQPKPLERLALETDYDADVDDHLPGTRWGGFLKDVDAFDPDFFKISPREAAFMDPQQRLLLETSWEALEDAGELPHQLTGSLTGIFIGLTCHDYNYAQPIEQSKDRYTLMGTNGAIAANRLSFFYDFVGPSLVVDTACSSSLVAIHLACQSLWQGESTLALAGGAQLMLHPQIMNRLALGGFLANDGQCKTFDHRANGYVRGEGVGIVVLKPLKQALADDNSIYALIRGSAINQDGRTNGLTAPNPRAQKVLLQAAYRHANVSPGDVQYIEAHGTGTKLGDPIEIKALGDVLATDRVPGNNCLVGSLKTNIGHTEAVAGLAGLFKVALALKHQQIPPSLNLEKVNPYIQLDQFPLQLVSHLTPWPQSDRPSIAGVSSFGFGGTNAHVVLQSAPPTVPKLCLQSIPEATAFQLLTLSAKSEPALKAMAIQHANFLETHPQVLLTDVCFTANQLRSKFTHRLAIVTNSVSQLQNQLLQFAQTSSIQTDDAQLGFERFSGCYHVTNRNAPKVAFLFTGQGAQYVQMGHQLYVQAPVFRAAIDECAQLLVEHLKVPLLEVLYPESAHSGTCHPDTVHQTAYAQPALFALEYALAKLWQSWGMVPNVLLGHSLGEYVAACLAGIFSLADGLKLVTARGQLMQALPAGGRMVAARMSEETAVAIIEATLSGWQIGCEEVAIAAINGPNSVVLSGTETAMVAICQTLTAQNISHKPLQVSHAFHSPMMAPMLADFRKIAHDITYHPPQCPVISTVTGQLATDRMATPDYWCQQITHPVRFADAMTTLAAQCNAFIEVGPQPVLLGLGQECLPKEMVAKSLWLPSLRQSHQGWQQMLLSLGTLQTHGSIINWPQVTPEQSGKPITLPTYPFQRQRYWMPLDHHQPPTKKPTAPQLSSSQLTEMARLSQLKQVDTQSLLAQLTADFSLEEVKLLPRLLERLATIHQTPPTAESPKQAETSPNLQIENINWEKLHHLDTPPEERLQHLKYCIGQVLSQILGKPREQIDWHLQLADLGFDSLMATEFRHRLEAQLKLDAPVEFLAQLPLNKMVEHMMKLLEKGQANPSKAMLPNLDQAKLWIQSTDSSKAQLRLFCFPHAGTGASLFKQWPQLFPDDIEVCPIQLPGRENRYTEPPVTQLKLLLKTLLPLLEPSLDKPFAFFGHSMGALLAFELTRELRRRQWPLPTHLFTAAHRAPQISDLAMPIHHLPDDRFIAALQKFEGIPKELLQTPALMMDYLPCLRADFQLLETYVYTNQAPLDCPITALGGGADPVVTLESMKSWQRQTTMDFQIKLFPGGHFFLRNEHQALVTTIIQTLSQKSLQTQAPFLVVS